MYTLNGNLNLKILEACSIPILNDREVHWTKIHNTIENGLNIIEAGAGGGSGVYNSNSRYSKRTILKVFAYLYSGKYASQAIIYKKCKVPASLVRDIFRGKTHLWLKEEHPDKYSLMNKLDYKSIGRSSNIIDKAVISPDGEVHTITSIADFIKGTIEPKDEDSKAIAQGFYRLLANKQSSYKG